MKGRKIFGGLVPYGEPWRAGANEATTFVIDADMNVGGKAVPAGSYTIFTLPTADAWTLIISKQTGEWGVPYPGRIVRLRARADESVEAGIAGREFHDRVRPERRCLHAAPGLGDHAGVGADHGEEVAEIYC